MYSLDNAMAILKFAMFSCFGILIFLMKSIETAVQFQMRFSNVTLLSRCGNQSPEMFSCYKKCVEDQCCLAAAITTDQCHISYLPNKRLDIFKEVRHERFVCCLVYSIGSQYLCYLVKFLSTPFYF